MLLFALFVLELARELCTGESEPPKSAKALCRSAASCLHSSGSCTGDAHAGICPNVERPVGVPGGRFSESGMYDCHEDEVVVAILRVRHT